MHSGGFFSLVFNDCRCQTQLTSLFRTLFCVHVNHATVVAMCNIDLEEHGQDTSEVGRLPPAQPAKDSGRHMQRSHVPHRGVKADWAAKITGHCSGEAASDGRSHHQDAAWTTSQSCYVMDSLWKWQETRSASKDMAVHIQRRPCGQRSRLERRPGCGYRQAQMANSCCPLS